MFEQTICIVLLALLAQNCVETNSKILLRQILFEIFLVQSDSCMRETCNLYSILNRTLVMINFLGYYIIACFLVKSLLLNLIS